MGLVWRAADELLARPVAVKLLRSEYAGDPAFLERFRTEARRTAALSHPGIASVFDYGEVEEPIPAAYLVMELIEGVPLSALLVREGRLDAERTLDVIAQAALALGSAHQAGLVHRDVKPSNLLVRRDGVVKVTDFGIARATSEAPQTETGLVLGTVAYLSPEQVAGHPATPASDVYALGVVAYECLAGRRPFTGEHPVALALAHHRRRPPPLPPDVPEPVRALVEMAMAKDPAARPANASVLARHALATRAALFDAPGAGATGQLTAAHLGTADLGTALPATASGLTIANGTAGAHGLPAGNGRPSTNGHRREHPAQPGVNRHGWSVPTADPGQETSEWTPVSLLLMLAWSRARQKRPIAVAAVVSVLALISVTLTGATGHLAATVAVPSVTGQPITTAGQALARAGLKVRERAQSDRSTRAGVVLAQEPAAGTRLTRGGLVTLTVSSGPPSRVGGEPSKAPREGDGGTVTGASSPGRRASGAAEGYSSEPPARGNAKKVTRGKHVGHGRH